MILSKMSFCVSYNSSRIVKCVCYGAWNVFIPIKVFIKIKKKILDSSYKNDADVKIDTIS